MKIAGSCHCQAVKYSVESDGPYPYQKCYCTICRKTSGGEGYSINLSADADTLQVEGKQHLQTYQAMVTRDGNSTKACITGCSAGIAAATCGPGTGPGLS